MPGQEQSVYERLRRLVAESLGIDEGEVVPEADFEEDFNAAREDVIDLVVTVEEAFHISIPDDVIPELRTVRDVVEYLEERVT